MSAIPKSAKPATPAKSVKPLPALKGVRVLSLSLNLPGPAALQRCRAIGARCVKIEPPGGDPMQHYDAAAYRELGEGIRVLRADLKAAQGQKTLQRELARSDVLLTSFRPSALNKLGLGWKSLHRDYPALSLVSIVGARGAAAEEPGHDLTYLAAHDLVNGLELPATLFADMSGALMAAQAVLEVTLLQNKTGRGSFQEIALSDAAAWLATPRRWGLTQPAGAVGGAHAGYRVYACADGRVAVAALEPHFASVLCALAGSASPPGVNQLEHLLRKDTHEVIAQWIGGKTRRQLDALAREHDLPLITLE